MARLAEDKKEALEKQRRDQIVTAAVEQWLAEGFDATSVAAIAQRAGVAKGTVYLYFESKESILAEVVRRYSLAPDVRGFLEAIENVAPATAIRFLVRGILSVLLARVDLVSLLVREISLRPEHAQNFVENVVLPTNRALADYLDAAGARGELDLDGIDTFVAARALVGTITIFVFTQQIFGAAKLRPIPDEAIVETISKIFCTGLGASS